MAGFTLTVTRIRQVDNKLYVQWSDGLENEFSSLADAIAVTRDTLAESKNVLRAMGIARYLRLDPTGGNPAVMVGHSITYTDTSNSMVVVT